MVNHKTGFGHGERKFSSSQIIVKKAQKNNVVVDKKNCIVDVVCFFIVFCWNISLNLQIAAKGFPSMNKERKRIMGVKYK